mmetsp:Transcript_41476/g.119592  ORF Transcript_41476/g.119592 Transcript_41476/m.119592 type:complete len:213 (+) Transcript_41476:90-728(+)
MSRSTGNWLMDQRGMRRVGEFDLVLRDEEVALGQGLQRRQRRGEAPTAVDPLPGSPRRLRCALTPQRTQNSFGVALVGALFVRPLGPVRLPLELQDLFGDSLVAVLQISSRRRSPSTRCTQRLQQLRGLLGSAALAVKRFSESARLARLLQDVALRPTEQVPDLVHDVLRRNRAVGLGQDRPRPAQHLEVAAPLPSHSMVLRLLQQQRQVAC